MLLSENLCGKCTWQTTDDCCMHTLQEVPDTHTQRNHKTPRFNQALEKIKPKATNFSSKKKKKKGLKGMTKILNNC